MASSGTVTGAVRRVRAGHSWLAPCVAVVLSWAAANAAPEARSQNDESEWVVVQEWSGGHGRVTTEVFTPGSRPWRVSFKATSGERWGLLDVFVRTTDQKHVGSAVNMHLMAFEEDQRQGTMTVDSAEQQFVLDIVSDNLSWQVVVERRK